MTDEERRRIVETVASDPTAGAEVVGSGGIRKVRVAGRGKGKSGGCRIMVAYVGPDAPAYILALLSKGERSIFSTAEVKAMKALTTALRDHWRRRKR